MMALELEAVCAFIFFGYMLAIGSPQWKIYLIGITGAVAIRTTAWVVSQRKKPEENDGN